MGIFEKYKTLTVNEGINRTRTEKGAVLLDVRPKEDYKKGHVAGAVNIPMDKMELIKTRIPSTDTRLYVVGDYNNNPKKAIRALKKLGYNNAIPSGNMEDHHGILKK